MIEKQKVYINHFYFYLLIFFKDANDKFREYIGKISGIIIRELERKKLKLGKKINNY